MTENEQAQLNPVVGPQTDNPMLDTEKKMHYQLKVAGFWPRFWAYLIDLLIISSLGGLIIKPIFRVADWAIINPPFLLFTPYKLTMLIMALLYFALMTKYYNQTVGKMILGIKVIAQQDEKLTLGAIFYREIIGRFISKMLLIPYLFVVFMPKKEALHDIFADTMVVHEHVFEQVETSPQSHNGEQLQVPTTI